MRTLLATLATLVTLAAAPACAHVDQTALAQWAAAKAQRFAQCQLQNPASREQAEACLGEFARDLGTDACAEVEARLATLPHESDAAAD